MDADYELLDVGGGRRLERFGSRIVDRPAPAVVDPPRDPSAWRGADLRFERGSGWRGATSALEPWPIEVASLRLELRPTDAGQVGLFPEHLGFLPWLRDRVVRPAAAGDQGEPPIVLNLFASTGAATLALAAAGAAVTHVDAARSAVAWARRNADRSGLGAAPIRWLVDDAATFIAREGRRGRRYAGLILDPPAYGHGAGGRAWQLDAGLDPLLADVAAIAGRGAFVLLTAHTPGFGPERLARALGSAFPDAPEPQAAELILTARSGAQLPLGAFARIIGR